MLESVHLGGAISRANGTAVAVTPRTATARNSSPFIACMPTGRTPSVSGPRLSLTRTTGTPASTSLSWILSSRTLKRAQTPISAGRMPLAIQLAGCEYPAEAASPVAGAPMNSPGHREGQLQAAVRLARQGKGKGKESSLLATLNV